MVSCQDSLNDRLDILENRVIQLEELCSTLNEEINSMQELVTALENNDFVTAVVPVTSDDGTVIGYQITFSKSGTVILNFGADGKDGTPVIGVKKGEDGCYYWTLNGEFIIDENGNPVRASAIDGKDGVVPQLKVEDGFWYVSYDNGLTWEKYGEAREGSYGFFDSISVNDASVEIVIGGEKLILPRQMQAFLTLSVGKETNVFPGSTMEISYVIENATESTSLLVESNGYYTAALQETTETTGTILVHCPPHYVDGYINVILTDNGYSFIRVINFSEGKILFSEGDEYYLSATGGAVTVNFSLNFDYSLTVSSDDAKWITLPEETRTSEMTNDALKITVQPNQSSASRIGKIGLKPVNMTVPFREIIIHQAGVRENADSSMIFKVVADVANDFTAYLPLDDAATLNCTIDWGDGTIENIAHDSTLPISHRYDRARAAHYLVSVNGTVKSLNSDGLPSHSVTEVIQWGKTGLESLETAFMNNDRLTAIHQHGGEAFKNLKHARRVFENCYSLTLLPESLFADCLQVSDFNSLFWHCASLEKIPAGLFRNCEKAVNFDSVFGGCISLSEVPADLFSSCPAIETVRNLFAQCGSLQHVPADLFAQCKEITSFNATFHSCAALTEIPAEIFSACSKADDYTWIFYGCHSLRTLPKGLFSNTNKANFFNAFYNCTGLTTLPDDLFATCSESTNFDGVFNTCLSLESLPVGLFDHCIAAVSFKETFRDCDQLTSLPTGLFAQCPSAADFEGTFNGCLRVKAIPENFFGMKASAVKFVNTFLYCSSLETVADDLFSGCSETTAFEGTFKNCVSLKSVGNIFQNCAAVTRFYETFRGCSALETVSEKLFSHSPKATDFASLFRDCSALQTIPEHLFDKNTEANSFSQTFANCKALKTLPVTIFDQCLNVTNFNQTFYNCFSLEGESPFTVIDDVKYHLYERESRTDIFKKPTSKRDCFESCIQFSDYYEIPISWK